MAAVGAYSVFFFAFKLKLSITLAILLGIIFTGLLGILLDKLVFLPMRKKKSSTMVMLVASLGAFTLLQATIAMLFTSQFQTLSGLIENQKIYTIFTASITQIQVIAIFSALVIFLGLKLLLKFTRFGQAVVAVSDDEEVAKIVGINTNQIISRVFFLGSAVTGIAGIFIGLDTGMEPTMGLVLLLSSVVAAIVGGVRSLSGAFLGAFLVALAENFGIWKIAGEWRPAIAFGILILFLLFRPQGIIKE